MHQLVMQSLNIAFADYKRLSKRHSVHLRADEARWMRRFCLVMNTDPRWPHATARYHIARTVPDMYRLGATAQAMAWAAKAISDEYAICRYKLCQCRDFAAMMQEFKNKS